MKIFPNGQSIIGRKVVKWGIDPTGSRLHLGHFVAIRFLRNMLREHRDVVVVIGDLTAQIGDPSGVVKERPMLEREVVDLNANLLESQVKKLLPTARIVRNREISNNDPRLVSALGQFTANELLDRAAFQERSVRMNELVVPVIQALDSIALEAEVEVGGEDQEFNFSITRGLQKVWKQEPEVCVLFPLIRGTDGRKMSKSLGNCVWLDAPDIFGKVMSISDDVMEEWIPLLTDGIGATHPKKRKEELAVSVIQQLS